jgi:hypothetical protein
MPADEEAAYVAELSDEERHCVVGLGGSQVYYIQSMYAYFHITAAFTHLTRALHIPQKAEVAWLDKNDIPYEQLDVSAFTFTYMPLFAEAAYQASLAKQGNSMKFSLRHKLPAKKPTGGEAESAGSPKQPPEHHANPMHSANGWSEGRVVHGRTQSTADELTI